MVKLSIEEVRDIIKGLTRSKGSQSIHLTHQYSRSDIIEIIRDSDLIPFIVDLDLISAPHDVRNLIDQFSSADYKNGSGVGVLIVGNYKGYAAHGALMHSIYMEGCLGDIKFKMNSVVISMIENMVDPGIPKRMIFI